MRRSARGQGDAVVDLQGVAGAALGSDGENAGLDDGASVELVEAQLLEAVGRLRSKEIERGVSLVGPHRDDLVLTLGGLPAKGYASHGESWSFALALRLASYELLTNGFDDAGDWGPDGEPVLILDDVFAELDARRRERLAELVAPARQVLITAAVPGDVPELLAGARVDVMGGRGGACPLSVRSSDLVELTAAAPGRGRRAGAREEGGGAARATARGTRRGAGRWWTPRGRPVPARGTRSSSGRRSAVCSTSSAAPSDQVAGVLKHSWSTLVGPEIAEHCEYVSFSGGALTVRASSTSWATQLRFLAPVDARPVRGGPR